MGKIKHISWFLTPHSTQKLNIGGILSISHRPSAYDLRLMGCPDVPSGKEASAIVLIVPLFAETHLLTEVMVTSCPLFLPKRFS